MLPALLLEGSLNCIFLCGLQSFSRTSFNPLWSPVPIHNVLPVSFLSIWRLSNKMTVINQSLTCSFHHKLTVHVAVKVCDKLFWAHSVTKIPENPLNSLSCAYKNCTFSLSKTFNSSRRQIQILFTGTILAWYVQNQNITPLVLFQVINVYGSHDSEVHRLLFI